MVLEALRVTAAIIAVEPVRDDPADPSLLGRGGGVEGSQGLCPKGSAAIQLLVFFVVVVQLVGCLVMCYVMLCCYVM